MFVSLILFFFFFYMRFKINKYVCKSYDCLSLLMCEYQCFCFSLLLLRGHTVTLPFCPGADFVQVPLHLINPMCV